MSPQEHRTTKSVAEIESPSLELVTHLLQAADSLRRFYTRVVTEEGLTLQQYNVLKILYDAGPDGLPTMIISDRLLEQTPGLTRIVDRLENAGLVKRNRHLSDRRKVVCQLTNAAKKLLERLEPEMESANAMVLASLDESEQIALAELLQRIRRTTDEH